MTLLTLTHNDASTQVDLTTWEAWHVDAIPQKVARSFAMGAESAVNSSSSLVRPKPLRIAQKCSKGGRPTQAEKEYLLNWLETHSTWRNARSNSGRRIAWELHGGVDALEWLRTRVKTDAMERSQFDDLARLEASDFVAVLTLPRTDASACGKGWKGTKGACVRAKASDVDAGKASLKNISKGGAVDADRKARQERIAFLKAKKAGDKATQSAAPESAKQAIPKDSRVKKLKKEAKHQGIHLAENIAAWKVGKVVGGAIAGVAASHGANPEAAKLVAETGIQALTATALSLRDPSKRKPRDVAAKFVAEAGAAFVGKAAHGGMESAAASLGASAKVQGIASLLSGKAGGIGTNVGLTRSGKADKAGQWLTERGKRLQGFYKKAALRRDALHLDSQLSKADAQALADLLYDLSAYALLQAADKGKLKQDSLKIPGQCDEDRGWVAGPGGKCIRKKGNTRKALEGDAVNAAQWSMGKVVGGAIATAAQSHGITDPPALLLAESGVQALLTTAQKARKQKMGAGAIAKEFISETVALMATKFEPAWDDGIRGGSDDVRMMIDRVTSPDAPAQAKALYRQSRDRLAGLVKGRKLRLDADEFTLTEAEGEALLMLEAIALGMVMRRAKG